MIITIACVLLLIVGFLILFTQKDFDTQSLGAILAVIGGFLSSLCFTTIVSTQMKADLEYQNMLHQKEMIEYRIERMDENVVGNEMLFNDIVEFNNELRAAKKYVNNPFVNWFQVSEIATIDYIELK